MLFLLPLSLAGDPVLYTGSPARAIQQVSDGTGIPPWELEPVDLNQIGQAAQPTVVGVRATRCTSTVGTSVHIGDALSRAESRLSYSEYALARSDLAAAENELRCLKEPAEASQGARLYLLLGVAAAAQGDAVLARSAFERALFFVPTLAYDNRLPPDGRQIFQDTVQQHQALKGVHLLVAGGSVPLWIDGKVATPENGELLLKPGQHLLQVLSTPVDTQELDLRNDAVLLLPGSGDAGWLDAPSERWTGMAMAAKPGSKRAFLVNSVGAWAYGGSLSGWTRVPQVNLAARERLAMGLIGGGVAMGLIGGGTTLATSIFGYAHPNEGTPYFGFTGDVHDAALVVGIAGDGLQDLLIGNGSGTEAWVRTAYQD